jgi:geranylgeranyl diphosphate synthase, type II
MSDPAPHSPAKPTRRAAEGPGEATAAGLPEVVAAPRRQIDTHLASTLDLADLPPRLREAMAYATLSGGKRLRPLLAWHACVAAGGEGPEALPACAAVELVHCFSLVHDDLPALDDDDMRRGRPTLHRHAGEAMAILAGDALLTHAFGVLAGTGPPETARTLCRELSEACERMIAGQVLDTLGAGEHGGPGESDEDRLEAIHRGKTGAMLVASVRMGALSVPGCPDATLDALTAYGHAAGLMFQVVDDLLDVTQTTQHLGKRSGKDAVAGKLTYPGVLGVDRSRALVHELLAECLAAVDPLGPRAEPLRALARYLAVRTR